MAFPTIPTVAAGRVLFTLNTAGGATKTFPDLSSLTKAAGDLLIAICIEYDGNSTNAEFSSWGGSFTEFADQAGTATMAIGVAYKFSDGTETGTFTVTTADTSANDSCMILLAIPGAHASTVPEAGTMATGTAPDVGSLNPANWDAEDTLWIAVGASGEDATTGSYTGIGTAPTNYTSQADSGISADAAGGVEGSVAFRQLNAASEDAGAWSMDTSNARGAALLIAVRPSDAVIETPTPGGGITGGTAPVALTSSAAGGATGVGTTPAPMAPVTAGGGVGSGNAATATATVDTGGGIAGGSSPSALVTLSPGGALAGGVAPTEGGGTTETPTPGGALAGGSTPLILTVLTAQGSVAVGLSANAFVTLTAAGATAQGRAPTEDFPGAVVYSRNFDMPSPSPAAFDPPVPIGEVT